MHRGQRTVTEHSLALPRKATQTSYLCSKAANRRESRIFSSGSQVLYLRIKNAELDRGSGDWHTALACELKISTVLSFNPAVSLAVMCCANDSHSRDSAGRAAAGWKHNEAQCSGTYLGDHPFHFTRYSMRPCMPSETNRQDLVSSQGLTVVWECGGGGLIQHSGRKEHVTFPAYLPDSAFDDRLGSEHPLPDGRKLHVYPSATSR